MAEELNQAEMKNLCLKEGKNLWDSKYKPKPLQSVPEYPVPKELCQILKQNLQLHPNISEKGEEWLSFLKLLPELKDIEETNYLEILERLLFLEEYYSEGSIEQSSSSKKQLIRRLSDSSDRFIIRLPELAEDSSTLKPNDIVEVQEVSYLKKYNLEVVHVTKTYITVKAESAFLNSYKADGRYFIKLICSNWPIRVCHFAISLIRNYKLTLLLHPVLKEVSNQPKKDLNWFDKNIENNPEQMQAVQRILGRTAHPAPYILFGPPGTGKTATIVEAISQLSGSHLNRILVCTPSNAAADEITKRLLCNIPEHLLYRMLSPSVDKKDVAESIHSCLHFVGGAVTFLQKELIMSKKVVITTLVTCARLVRMNWWRNHFTYIFLDEAGQATQAESLIPFGLMRDEEERAQLIMSGDPKQLGPVVMTKHGQHLLGKSMLERLMDCSEPYQKNEENKYDPNFITKLLKNYRSHEALLRIPNQLFYNNELVACGGEDIYRAENWWELPREKFPVIFHAVHGYEEKDNNSPSVCNEIEAQVVMNYVYKLLGSPLGGTQIEEKDIGILTPFRYQRSIILQALNSKGLHNISVGTVESFQGQEKDIIIVTTVRSAIFQHDGKFHVGFLSDDKRFNVTITRAKSLLILVGNPKVLQIDDCWRKLIEYCLENKACVGDKFTLSDLTDVEMRNLISNRSHSSDQGTNSPKIKTENIVSEAKGISPSFVNGSLDEDFGTCNSYNNGALEDFPKHLRFPSSFNECF